MQKNQLYSLQNFASFWSLLSSPSACESGHFHLLPSSVRNGGNADVVMVHVPVTCAKGLILLHEFYFSLAYDCFHLKLEKRVAATGNSLQNLILEMTTCSKLGLD